MTDAVGKRGGEAEVVANEEQLEYCRAQVRGGNVKDRENSSTRPAQQQQSDSSPGQQKTADW